MDGLVLPYSTTQRGGENENEVLSYILPSTEKGIDGQEKKVHKGMCESVCQQTSLHTAFKGDTT